jgi:hypothetical protein
MILHYIQVQLACTADTERNGTRPLLTTCHIGTCTWLRGTGHHQKTWRPRDGKNEPRTELVSADQMTFSWLKQRVVVIQSRKGTTRKGAKANDPLVRRDDLKDRPFDWHQQSLSGLPLFHIVSSYCIFRCLLIYLLYNVLYNDLLSAVYL